MFDIVYHRQTSISDSPLRIRSHATLLVTSLPLSLFLVFQCRTSSFHFLTQKNNSQGSRLLSDRQPLRYGS
jgi:hypothetical protein